MLSFQQLMCLIWILSVGDINGQTAGDSYRTGQRVNMINENETLPIILAIKGKLTKLYGINGEQFDSNNIELTDWNALTYRITVGVMYESIVGIKINETTYNCTVELWNMPWLNGDKFQMKCNDGDSGRNKLQTSTYRLIDGDLQEIASANELAELYELIDATLKQRQCVNFKLMLNRIVNAQKISVNGLIYLANIEFKQTNGEIIECSVEAWKQPELKTLLKKLFIACETNVYKLNDD